MKIVRAAAAAAALLASCTLPARAQGPHASHVTIVVMENRNYSTIVGDPQAPYFNGILVPQGALLRRSAAAAHPSLPNYFALFSGSTQGVTSDACPLTFSGANVATQLAAAGLTFGGYAESIPRQGYEGCRGSGGLYARKHVPWAYFTNVPAGENRVYRGFPADPPALTWITPNMCHDMHDCSTRTGDDWLRANLPPILAWDARNDGLLIVTWDEADPDTGGTNHIPTIFVGPMVKRGYSEQAVDHYAVLHTIEAIFGLPCLGSACRAPLVSGIWL